MRPRLGGALLLALFACSLGLPRDAHATPPDLFGFGARSPGLAMTGASYVDSFESAYLNPANLGTVRRRSFFFGVSAGSFDLTLDGQRSPLEPVRGTTIGFTLPVPIGDVLKDRLTIGAGFYTPVNVLLRGDVRFTEVSQWAVLGRGQSLALYVAMGFDFHGILDGLQVGLGVSALAALVGDLRVQLDETSSFQSVVETLLVATFAPNVGVRFEQPPQLRRSASAPAEFGVGLV
jgi:long-chain fatty acid transport protein